MTVKLPDGTLVDNVVVIESTGSGFMLFTTRKVRQIIVADEITVVRTEWDERRIKSDY